jgi:hypothetical protein
MQWNRDFRNQEQLELLIKKYQLDRRSLFLEASYEILKNDKLYDNHLILYLTDDLNNLKIEIGKFYLSDLIINNGVKEIDEEFNRDFIDFIQEYLIESNY